MKTFVKVKEADTDLLRQTAKLVTQNYGKKSHYAKWIKNGFRPYTAEYFLGQVKNPLRDLYVMLDGGAARKVIGTVVVQVVERERHALIHKLTASSAHKGIGKIIMRKAEAIVRRKKIKHVRVEAFSPAIRLVQYYVDLGYDKVIEYKKLEEDEYTKFTKCQDVGFITLEKAI